MQRRDRGSGGGKEPARCVFSPNYYFLKKRKKKDKKRAARRGGGGGGGLSLFSGGLVFLHVGAGKTERQRDRFPWRL